MHMPFAAATESVPIQWLAFAFVACYALLGCAIFGKWKDFGCFAKTLYFLVFPLHAAVIGVAVTLFEGVDSHRALWKTAMTVFFFIILAILCVMVMAPK